LKIDGFFKPDGLVLEKFNSLNIKVIMQPSQFLLENTTVLVNQVTGVQETEQKDTIFVNGSIPDSKTVEMAGTLLQDGRALLKKFDIKGTDNTGLSRVIIQKPRVGDNLVVLNNEATREDYAEFMIDGTKLTQIR